MGFSASAVVALLALALLASGTHFAQALFGSWEALDEGHRAALEREGAQARTALTISEVKLIPVVVGDPYVILRNDGGTVLDPSKSDLLVAGAHANNRIANWTVDGVAAGTVWPPETWLYLRLTGSLPSRVAYVADNGVTAYWGS